MLKGGDTVSKKEAGLPNIIGTSTNTAFYNAQASGAFELSAGEGTGGGENTGRKYNLIFNVLEDFDCTLQYLEQKSNPIYGASTTIQPPALQLIPQIRY